MWNPDFQVGGGPAQPSTQWMSGTYLGDPFLDVDFLDPSLPVSQQASHDSHSIDHEDDSNSPTPNEAGDSQNMIGSATARRKPRRGTDIRTKAADARSRNMIAQRAYRQRVKEKTQGQERRVKELETMLENMRVERDSLQTRNALLEAAARMKTPTVHVPAEPKGDEREWSPAGGWSELPKNQTLVLLHIVQTPPLKLTSAEIAAMNIERFAPLYTDAMKCFADKLAEADGDESSPAGRQLEMMVNEIMALCAAVSTGNPKFRFGLRTFQLPHQPPPVTRPNWQAIADSLGFSNSQKQSLLAFRQTVATDLEDTRAEYQMHLMSINLSADVRGDSSKPISKELIANLTGLELLHAVLKRQQTCIWSFIAGCLRRAMRPYQVASMMVACYPYPPDLLALTAALEPRAAAPGPSGVPMIMESEAAGRANNLLPANSFDDFWNQL